MNKARLLIPVFLCAGGSMYAQHEAMFSYQVNIAQYDTIYTYEWLNENPCAATEKALGKEYGEYLKKDLVWLFTYEELKKINSRYTLQYSLTDELERFITKTTTENIQNEYNDNFFFFKWNSYQFYTLFHHKVRDKTFRDILYNRAVEMMCRLCAYYPRDYKEKLIKAFSDALIVIDDMQKHKCEVKNDNTKSWKPLMIFVDGKPDEKICWGISGFLLRRIYMDNVPYSEIREKVTTLITKLRAVDTTKNAQYLKKYVINNDICYNVSSTANYFTSTSNKLIFQTYDKPDEKDYPHSITCRYNNGDKFYVIGNYPWCKTELKTIILDRYLNVIYHEPIRLSQPLNITLPQSAQPKKKQKSAQKPTLSK